MIGWAIAGTGTIARRFASDMRLSRTGRVVAIASRDPERARALAAAVGGGIAAGDPRTILARNDVDAVYVAGSNETHAAVALAALSAGKPVLVEKPFATSAAEAEAVADAARASGVLAMEAMWMRFTPGILRLKALLDEGAIGRPVRLDASLSFARPGAADDPLLDLGVYPISLALHLFGPASSVSAIRAGGGVCLSVDHGGALLSAAVGYGGEGANRAALIGERAILSSDAPFFCPSHLTLRRTNFAPSSGREEPGAPLGEPPRRPALRQALRTLKGRRVYTPFQGTGLHYQADHFAELLARGLTDSPVMPLAQSVETLRVVEAASRAAEGSVKVERGR